MLMKARVLLEIPMSASRTMFLCKLGSIENESQI